MHILLIAGGWSEERQVSINGARQIRKALTDLGHQVDFFDLKPDFSTLVTAARKADAAFINLHGNPGEDGSIQALLDDIGLPYQGAGPLGSFQALNKNLSKQIFANHHLPTPGWTMLTGNSSTSPLNINYPLVAKPNLGGSSLGMSFLSSSQELKSLINSHNPCPGEIILEEYISGIELTCAVLGDEALPPILIKPGKSFFFDYASKYEPDGAQEICPAPVDRAIVSKVSQLALEAHQVLGLRHYSRTDFILDKNSNLFILETNTLPGMTQTSLLPKAALSAGFEFTALINRLLAMAVSPNT
ncbi:MAG: D-alanine--D-alanine ligase family protein [Desulfonatronovibrionaceae bacterium]